MKNIFIKKIKEDKGFTLVELLVAIFILSIFAVLMVQGLNITQKAYSSNKIKTEASAVANQEIEKIRSMDFEEIGIVGGDPVGSLAPESEIDDFTVTRSVSWVSESNYKIKQIKIIVSSASLVNSIKVITEITPLSMSIAPSETTVPSETTSSIETTTTVPTETTIGELYPPYDLIVASDVIRANKRTVIIQWRKPLNTAGSITYNIYRNNAVIITSTSEYEILQYTNDNFIKNDLSPYTYFITAVYGSLESAASNEITTVPQ